VILGAGASRGEASQRGGVLPPLDSDFFAQLQRLKSLGPGAVETLRVACELFGPLPDVTMESYFTQIEFVAELASMLNVGKSVGLELPGASYFRSAHQSFLTALLDVLSEAGVAMGRDALPPELHRALVGVLESGDSVISFNYDLLMDSALKQEGSGKWDAADGYHIRCTGCRDSVLYWQPDDAVCLQDSIALCKLHGSVNWAPVDEDRMTYGVTLTEPPFKADKMLVLPPAWSKPIRHFPISELWGHARASLLQSRVLIVVGYSLPLTDMWAQALLRCVAVERGQQCLPFASMLIANPDESVCSKVVSVMGAAVGADTRVQRFKGFEELIDYLV